MTVATRPSESQSRALYDRETPYREVKWLSERQRANRRTEPPKGVDAKLAWFRREWEMAMPNALHGQGVWTDRVTKDERARGQQPVGSSDLGAPALNGEFRHRLEESVHSKNEDGDLTQPLLSALDWLSGKSRAQYETLMSLVYRGSWDWRTLADAPMWRYYTDANGAQQKVLVRVMDHDVLELVLDRGLDALWREFTNREAISTVAA